MTNTTGTTDTPVMRSYCHPLYEDTNMCKRIRIKLLYFCFIAVTGLMFYRLLTFKEEDLNRTETQTSDEARQPDSITIKQKLPLEDHQVSETPHEKQNIATEHSMQTSKIKVLLVTSSGGRNPYVDGLFIDDGEVLYLRDPLSVYDPASDTNVTDNLIRDSLSRGYTCIDKPVDCRLEYLFSCHLLLYFNEALFRTPRKSATVKAWYSGIFTSVRNALGDDALKTGLDESCMEAYSTIVVKVTQVKDIEDVIPLMEAGVKVIYMVQDPRDLLASHLQNSHFKTDDDILSYTRDQCKRYGLNLNFLNRASEQRWRHQVLRENLILVRYEDIVKNLPRMTMKIDRFVKSDTSSENGDTFADIGLSIRDSEYTEFASWRSELSVPTVQQVEMICQNIMNRFGYYHVSEEARNAEVPSIGKVDGILPYYFGL